MGWTKRSCRISKRYASAILVLLSTSLLLETQADRQKWETKLLETRVADFARASGDRSDSEEPETNGQHPKPGSPSGPSSSMTQPAFGLSFPTGSHGLALPGQVMQGNYGSGSQQQMGMRGYDGVNVKQDPDDLLRLRGGAVSSTCIRTL